jgi:hypothetical protein
VKKVSGATIPFQSLDDNEDIQSYLDYIHASLVDNAFIDYGDAPAYSAQPPVAQPAMPPGDEIPTAHRRHRRPLPQR